MSRHKKKTTDNNDFTISAILPYQLSRPIHVRFVAVNGLNSSTHRIIQRLVIVALDVVKPRCGMHRQNQPRNLDGVLVKLIVEV
ncbi:hypothetical protein HW132_33825 [Brasilonema sp. CT11]|nr:hypothetical protein [Brasilonema sp. CT11]